MIFSSILWKNNFGSIFERIYFSTGVKWQNDYLIFFVVYPLWHYKMSFWIQGCKRCCLITIFLVYCIINFIFLSYLCKEI